jgi:hypothetical protein
MSAQKRNISQEFEALLNGKSILELSEEESATALKLLTQIVKDKSLKALTKIELQALVEELAEITAINMFNGSIPEDWKKEVLNKLESTPEKEGEWNYSSILDYYLHNIGMWHDLDAEEKEALAKTMLKYLEGDREYYDYCTGYVEGYLDDEDE